MKRTLLGALMLAALAPPLVARDDPKDKPKPDETTPAEAYKALLKEHQEAQNKLFQAYRQAKTDADKEKALAAARRGPEGFAARFLELAQKHPKDPAALDALLWVVQNKPASPEADRAVDMIARDHVRDAKVQNLLPLLVRMPMPANEKLIRAVLAKSDDKNAKGKATLYLGQFLKEKAGDARTLKGADAKLLGQLEQVYGKEFVQDLKAAEPDKLEKEAETVLEAAAEKYGDVDLGRGQTIAKVIKPILFEMRFLSIGKKAPDIEGEDIDGKKFKLSDYKGKVVVLDFWGHW